MDKNKLEELIKAKSKLIDIELQDKKDAIDALFEKNGTLLSGQHKNAEGRAEAQANNLKEILRLELEDQFSQSTQDQDPDKTSDYKSSILYFYPLDGRAEFRGVDYVFRGKVKVLLKLLKENKNTPFSLQEIIRHCNNLITTSKHQFKTSKDMADTILYLKKKLRVSKGEFFPIEKRETGWIWLEKM